MRTEFRVPSNLIAFIENNDKRVVEEVLSAFSSFWEIDRTKLDELIKGEKENYGKVYIENFRQ
jgi:hypothetical protein